MLDYYEILQVAPSASDEVVKSAYRALVKLYHPDLKKYPPEICKQKLQELNQAFEVLSDPQKREVYDRKYQERQVLSQSSQRKIFDADQINQEKNGIGRRGFLSSLFESFGQEMDKRRKIRDNAFYDGMNMESEYLIRKFKKSSGPQRVGYAMALEEKGLLERDDNGDLTPTEEFRRYWR